jgi:hypothetical protein
MELVVWERLRTAALVAGAAFLSVAPYTYYLSTLAFSDGKRRGPIAMSEEELLRADLTYMALIVVIAGLVGTFASERYGLAGLGDKLRVKQAWPFAVLALVFGTVFYFIFGRRVALVVPAYYPTELGWALAMMIKAAVFDEVVQRHGMMTIVSGVARRPWIANVLTAIFFTAIGLRSMAFFGVEIGFEPIFFGRIVASIAIHLVLGHVYARYGLFASCSVHLALEVEKLIHVAIS